MYIASIIYGIGLFISVTLSFVTYPFSGKFFLNIFLETELSSFKINTTDFLGIPKPDFTLLMIVAIMAAIVGFIIGVLIHIK